MKLLWLWLLLLLPLSSFSQTEEEEEFVLFNLKYPSDTLSVDGIDWEKENLTSEFTLRGKTQLLYAIKIENDTTAKLLINEKEKWVVQENIPITGWALRRIDKDVIFSEFKIKDFDKDGDEDLICWVNSNMNGNVWTIIFLNDQKTQKLVKLWDSAEETDIWDDPVYDNRKKIIECELYSGVYGFQYKSTYKLNDLEAIPILS
ncbi:hypothetical protein CHU92_01110 [Flavobacterium cyanobacteriorum]|uniref:VCBS repeat-containing protein n=1 Tax=Flavobacterium cyanobacteriorum TaxID=2022802 RepID=A0A256A0K9_9FLAO|nr:hypothetical protein [Flavobacterium cyanobacteriorum]OYQ47212.1 hypothetical protein CHU92_01110 [Flavobacterium cyanobacteriorum]